MFAETQRISVLRGPAAGPARSLSWSPRSANAIETFNEMIAGLRQLLADGADPADLLSAVLDRSRVPAPNWRPASDPQDGARVENLEQLVTVLAGARPNSIQNGPSAANTEWTSPGIEAAVRRFSSSSPWWPTPTRSRTPTDGVVTLMTLHTAKGLEFPVVFLTGRRTGMFPHLRALTDDRELAEERRLAYVGHHPGTAAALPLRAATRSTWGQPGANPPSRFLDDIPRGPGGLAPAGRERVRPTGPGRRRSAPAGSVTGAGR